MTNLLARLRALPKEGGFPKGMPVANPPSFGRARRRIPDKLKFSKVKSRIKSGRENK